MPDGIKEIAARLLPRIALHGEFKITPIPGGRNNRVYRLEAKDQVFLLKKYFESQYDSRDRLGHEWALLDYLWAFGCRYAARPILADRESYVTLMEFISGERITLGEVTANHIDHAIRFFEDLNRYRFETLGKNLPKASEACFSVPEHLSVAQSRVDRLTQIHSISDIDREAETFVQVELIPLWREIRDRIEDAIRRSEISGDPLPKEEQCISPSDFGIHNALQMANGGIRFVDFEYAGWDDPAKLMADFANQPDMMLDRALSRRFSDAVICKAECPEKLRTRARLLEPLYQTKWVCICLNEFLLHGQLRRTFTGVQGEDSLDRKLFQLERARMMLGRARVTFSNS